MAKEFGVIISGLIVGSGHSVSCKIRATKVTLDGAPEVPPEYADLSIMDSNETDRLPDGDYELHVNSKKIPLQRKNGRFLARY